MKNRRWYKLDNAAKIFPPTTSQYDSKTFRFSVVLHEEVEESFLLSALQETLKDYPIFHSTLKKGIFWYYLEESEAKPVVEKEARIPCDMMYGLLYRVTYFHRRISLEVSHALTDATGTLAFLKSLTANYLRLKYQLKDTPEMDTASTFEKSDDSFEHYYQKARIYRTHWKKTSYRVQGLDYPENRIKIIEGRMATNQVKALAKQHGVTITAYMASLLMESIGKQMTMREKKKPVYLTVPVDLRKYFPSHTIRNFFNTISLVYEFQGEDSFETILASVKQQLEKQLTKEVMRDKMSEFVLLENIWVLRLVPRWIKDLVLKVSFEMTRRYHTMTLSNMGVVTMPELFQPYIDYFDVFASTDGIQLCMCSYDDTLVASFTSHFVKTEIEKNFFRSLSEKGLEIRIQTNVWEEEEGKDEVSKM